MSEKSENNPSAKAENAKEMNECVDGITANKGSKKRNKHKKKLHDEKKQAEEIVEITKDDENNETNVTSHYTIKELKAAMEVFAPVFSLTQKPAKTSEEALKKSYQFWNTQPVPRMEDNR
ncbi:unnamed protein product [Callosobruchus maculatus]|uniref:Uncharacterized protein n=1 Tax=Callosobruchus maculatus TaxID=64391 RepID=A0A653D687_CALMS|nr:unnamed protein product [Callosobruchus maculatus]